MSDVVLGKKARFTYLLLSGATVKEAAAACGRSERTGNRWLDDPAVKAALSCGQDAQIRALTVGLLDTLALATKRLRELLDDPSVRGYVRLGAIKAAFDAWARLHEQSDLADRIAALEEKMEVKA